MQVVAQLKHLHIAPRKVRLIAGLIRGLTVERAEVQLFHLTKRSADPISKLLHSAVSNAENNFNLPKSNLFIKEITVDEGIKQKRFMPGSMGSAKPIHKKTSHIRIILGERVAGLKLSAEEIKQRRAAAEAAQKQMAKQPAEAADEDKAESKPEHGPEREVKSKGIASGIKNAGRRFFRRKTV
ncbi:MAG: 50S ribosomal protein L22 [Candidatus Yanofskybacteria bacterium RIFCSPLOWO2_02_FULL_45_10]|uniref:Large ribosomal subunit protein uL22 n=2 Tax=Candidatus Yanofskyibacteriota TaxID=1752733 RepID=A0A1F8G101_9BACT|nr:MAG: 50S ribosomal protein L22 [Candidatus Yanofskybacteria bacterium RIFCSPHIGHO2_12_FULL_45_19b]OGN32662.1 MAG: 50S ribosomal protein L22 [Candidatus Yanofskybacteria bacterium RIFCSPLOWO2_02_FULL_45_10]HXK35696.1 50S ribosomal protein L22 [Candidatus Paceibacterota bacterium]